MTDRSPMTDRLVIFDMDGTLVDSQAQIVAAMTAAFAAVDRDPPPRAEMLSVVGLSLYPALSRLALDPGEVIVERMVEAYRETYFAQRTQSLPPLYGGTVQALDALAERGVTLAVATGASRRGMEGVLEGHGIRARFATLHCADMHPSKPHPEMIASALQATGVAARDAVMLGDADHDMAMAAAAGVVALGAGWGMQPPERLSRAGAAAVLEGMGDLVPWLDAHWEDSDA